MGLLSNKRKNFGGGVGVGLVQLGQDALRAGSPRLLLDCPRLHFRLPAPDLGNTNSSMTKHAALRRRGCL